MTIVVSATLTTKITIVTILADSHSVLLLLQVVALLSLLYILLLLLSYLETDKVS